MTQQQAHDGRVLTVVARGAASYSHRWEIGDALVLADRGMLRTCTVRLRLNGFGPPFRGRFATVLDRFSGSWCRFLESWGPDGENGEKRGKTGKKWARNGITIKKGLLVRLLTAVCCRRRAAGRWTHAAPCPATTATLTP